MLDEPKDRLTSDDLSGQLHDIQGGLVTDYDTLAASFVFFKIGYPVKARGWLSALIAKVTPASAEAPHETFNIAFSNRGMRRMGVSAATLEGFPTPFREGMAARAAHLGDRGPSDPAHWQDGLGGADIHVLVWLTGPNAALVEARRAELVTYSKMQGVSEVSHIDASVQFEAGSGCPAAHFGYVDPVSQPAIAGLDDGAPGDGARDGDSWRPIKPGEFLLGYENELGETTPVPGSIELGLNGTFFAFRKAEQHVGLFRDYLKQGAAALWGTDDAASQERFAAKIVGRWRSGCPLALSPQRDDADIGADPKRANAFDHADDPDGLKCPLGAHIRRMNPRAAKLTTTTDINRKRVLRRGLEYGPALAEGEPDDGVERGQAGMIVCADLELQFEFLQSQWIDKGDFLGLPSDERDPLIGTHDGGGGFTVPGADMPFLFDLAQLVTVRGGEYFFAPSLTALRGLAARKF
ncbi:MAG: peroxidase [Pseudomonadota bacterium]